jgi:hypothetical protein
MSGSSSSKPFQLRPPQYAPDGSAYSEVSSTAETPTFPTGSLNVLPHRDRADVKLQPPQFAPDGSPNPPTPASEPPVDLQDSETEIERQMREADEAPSRYAKTEQPRSAAHEIADLVGHVVPESGPDRQSFFSSYMEEYAKDSKSAVQAPLLEKLNTWFVSLLEETTTAETAIRDFTFAMSEKGAPIDMQLEEFERVVHQLIWMRQLRGLLQTLELGEYVDVILSREIYTEFGRGAEIEAEINKAKQKRGDAESFVKDALSRIIDVLSNLSHKPQLPTKSGSVFHPGPVRSRIIPAPAPAPKQEPPAVTPAA